jgi:catechol 2,3-dioxygenase-like lactoylglutathione lyase family enzyme
MNLNQITIYSNKPLASAEFYKRLGLRLIVDSSPRYVRFECPDGESTFSISESETAVASGNIVLYFECENLDEEVERLKSLGLTFSSEPHDEPWLWREARLNDPDGNRICLFSAGENRKNPPWKVKTD